MKLSIILLVLVSIQETFLFAQISNETIQTRFSPSNGFERHSLTGFSHYLRSLPLKEPSANVNYYNGEEKSNKAHAAVIDLDVGTRDLQQCADAIMRLRAEYLYSIKQFDKIHFNFTNGFRCDFSEWMKGKRIHVNGNKISWVQKVQPSNTYKNFRNYLTIIFSYAETLSLEKELKPVPINNLQIGDIFIQGGSPGHAILVVDVAIKPFYKRKSFSISSKLYACTRNPDTHK